MTARIRPSVAADAAAVVDLLNPIIRDTTLTFTTLEKTGDEMAHIIACHRDLDHGFLVAESDTSIKGFASFGAFRQGPGYRHTMELSIYVAPAAQGTGVAADLLGALEAHARRHDVHILIAGLSGENPKAERFFQKHGYRETARMPELGRKFGRYLDLILMQKSL